MTNITAKMAHSKESVELMCITQYNTFEFGKKIALLVISAALIVFGVVAQVSTSISLVCIMIGCFMLTGRNTVAKSRADAVIKQLGGQLPVFNYSFGPTKFSFNPDTEPVSYTSFSRGGPRLSVYVPPEPRSLHGAEEHRLRRQRERPQGAYRAQD